MNKNIKMASSLEKRLIKSLIKAMNDYELICPGDRIILSFSGGKDSFGLFQLLHQVFSGEAPFSPVPTVYPVLIDPGFSSTAWHESISRAQDYLSGYGYTLLVVKTEIAKKTYLPKNTKKPCFLCARMRRKKLYEQAEKLGCSKIAMAHHKDDIIETFLLNIFFSREISTMVPRQETFRGRFQIIRPLVFIEERLLQQYAWKNAFPVIENPCPEKGRSKRRFIKNLLTELERAEPNIKHNIFLSLKNAKPEFLL